MGAYDNCIILIPALQPDERLTQMIHGLHERGFHKIAVMDDGSSDDRRSDLQGSCGGKQFCNANTLRCDTSVDT